MGLRARSVPPHFFFFSSRKLPLCVCLSALLSLTRSCNTCFLSESTWGETLASPDDESTAELVVALPVVDHGAQGEGEGQRQQLLLHHRSDDAVGVHRPAQEELALADVGLVPYRGAGLLHLEVGLQLHANLSRKRRK